MESLQSNLVLIETTPDPHTVVEIHPEPAAQTSPPAEVTAGEKGLLTKPEPTPGESSTPEEGRKVLREHLVNRLNFVHFQDEVIQVHFTHRQCDRELSMAAAPQPCLGEILECRWAEKTDVASLLRWHDLKYILVPRGQKFIKAVVEVLEIDDRGARLALPGVSFETSHRKVERQRCRDISVVVIQNSSSFSGTLLDFNAGSFRVELAAAPPQSFGWIDASLPVTGIFFDGNQTYYSGECRVLRHSQGASSRSYVLEPLKHEIQRYRKAEIRSQRQKLSPSPNLIFRHPLTRKRVDLKVVDLSGSGLSVEEDDHAAVLLPGLILPEIEIRFADSLSITCSAQVVFRKPAALKDNALRVHCGLALIDVSARDHVKMLALLHQVKDKNSYICNDLDLEALWDFLFETGFIYPKKYALIHKNKEPIKQTYEKLYTRSPEIARHFVYQDNGVILGHMAMLRFWQNSWLIHHHAARKSALNKAGLVVLDQIGRFTHDTFRFRSLHMDYLVCYYRPQNKFPQRLFGGFAKLVDNPRGCSVDSFAYLSMSKAGAEADSLPEGWQLMPAAAGDVEDLEYFYAQASGGLMLKALDLEPATWQSDGLCREFQKLGFRRERHVFSLKRDGRLKALMFAHVSEIGLNLSELTNCVHAVVLDPEGLSRATLTAGIRAVTQATGQQEVPALIFPLAYAQNSGMPVEKTYNLWAFHIYGQGQAYLKYVNRMLRHV
ncbi:MAG: PilZ domain-containing protein [Deltaproteobacteria bacterium]|nr:PilZ domain-containing protein [Deltaproteobacteria bacterium]